LFFDIGSSKLKTNKHTDNITRACMTRNVKIIGGPEDFWLYSETGGYDITHPGSKPDAPKVYPRMTLQTQEARAVIDPAKTALVIIDLQNYFLSPALGRPSESLGIQVAEKLTSVAIPACRKAGIPNTLARMGLDAGRYRWNATYDRPGILTGQ
jgi:hypothetical protein